MFAAASSRGGGSFPEPRYQEVTTCVSVCRTLEGRSFSFTQHLPSSYLYEACFSFYLTQIFPPGLVAERIFVPTRWTTSFGSTAFFFFAFPRLVFHSDSPVPVRTEPSARSTDTGKTAFGAVTFLYCTHKRICIIYLYLRRAPETRNNRYSPLLHNAPRWTVTGRTIYSRISIDVYLLCVCVSVYILCVCVSVVVVAPPPGVFRRE